MRSFGELLKELGFNADASEDAQKAFFKHLVKAAEVPLPTPPVVPKKKSEPQQMEFQFDVAEPTPKKVS